MNNSNRSKYIEIQEDKHMISSSRQVSRFHSIDVSSQSYNSQLNRIEAQMADQQQIYHQVKSDIERKNQKLSELYNYIDELEYENQELKSYLIHMDLFDRYQREHKTTTNQIYFLNNDVNQTYNVYNQYKTTSGQNSNSKENNQQQQPEKLKKQKSKSVQNSARFFKNTINEESEPVQTSFEHKTPSNNKNKNHKIMSETKNNNNNQEQFSDMILNTNTSFQQTQEGNEQKKTNEQNTQPQQNQQQYIKSRKNIKTAQNNHNFQTCQSYSSRESTSQNHIFQSKNNLNNSVDSNDYENYSLRSFIQNNQNNLYNTQQQYMQQQQQQNFKKSDNNYCSYVKQEQESEYDHESLISQYGISNQIDNLKTVKQNLNSRYMSLDFSQKNQQSKINSRCQTGGSNNIQNNNTNTNNNNGFGKDSSLVLKISQDDIGKLIENQQEINLVLSVQNQNQDSKNEQQLQKWEKKNENKNLQFAQLEQADWVREIMVVNQKYYEGIFLFIKTFIEQIAESPILNEHLSDNNFEDFSALYQDCFSGYQQICGGFKNKANYMYNFIRSLVEQESGMNKLCSDVSQFLVYNRISSDMLSQYIQLVKNTSQSLLEKMQDILKQFSICMQIKQQQKDQQQ